MIKHPTIIWDWNGTLLDDTQASIKALNSLLRERDLPPLDRERYRASFGFPVRDFYRAIGITTSDREWEELSISYHARYQQQPTKVHPQARALIEQLQQQAVPQIILSACEQNLLNEQLQAHRLSQYFEKIQGTDTFDGRSKIEVGRVMMKHLARPTGSILIGDTLHDAEVAAALHCDCFLVACGHQNLKRLQRANCPVFDSLESLKTALIESMASHAAL